VIRKQNSPTGPDAPFVEPDVDRMPAAPKDPPATHGLPHQQHDEAMPYGAAVHPVPGTIKDPPPPPPPPPPSAPPRTLRGATGRTSTRTDGNSGTTTGTDAHLFDRAAAEELNQRFREALTGFVDSPADAVSDADEIAAQVTKLVTDSIRSRRAELKRAKSAASGDTEQLRLALHKYRTFLQSMLKL
jgi:hypothetical protein